MFMDVILINKMSNKKTIFALALFLVLLIPMASAINELPMSAVAVEAPQAVSAGQTVTQRFCFDNEEYSYVSTAFRITRIIDSNEQYISSNPAGTLKYIDTQNNIGAYLEWEQTLRVGEESCIEITVKYGGLVERQELPQVTVINERTGEVVSMSELAVIEMRCKQDSICDTKVGENFRTCFADCPSGGADGLCDGKYDGTCDPDCLTELDWDCKLNGGGKKMPVAPAGTLAAPAQPTKEEAAKAVTYDWAQINKQAEQVMQENMQKIAKEATKGDPRFKQTESLAKILGIKYEPVSKPISQPLSQPITLPTQQTVQTPAIKPPFLAKVIEAFKVTGQAIASFFNK